MLSGYRDNHHERKQNPQNHARETVSVDTDPSCCSQYHIGSHFFTRTITIHQGRNAGQLSGRLDTYTEIYDLVFLQVEVPIMWYGTRQGYRQG